MGEDFGEASTSACGGGGKSFTEKVEGEFRFSGGGGRGGEGERSTWGLTLSWLLTLVLSVVSDKDGGGGGNEGEGGRTGFLKTGGGDRWAWGDLGVGN